MFIILADFYKLSSVKIRFFLRRYKEKTAPEAEVSSNLRAVDLIVNL